MNISCEIIRDLLPLYHDGVCSIESKKMIEEHLAHCENCQKELAAMDDAIIIQIEHNLSEAEAVKKLSKRWRKGMLSSVLKGALMALLTVAGVLLFVYCFIGIQIG